MDILFVDRKVYSIYILSDVVEIINNLEKKNKKAVKKIKAYILRLAERIPNKPELWESIKNCENLFELKPKPYRLACYMEDDNILILHIWKVEKNISKEKRKNIEKACEIAKEVSNEFKELVRKR